MRVELFNTPDRHPYGMLEGYKNAAEKESVLALILKKCIEVSSLTNPVITVHLHPAMVEDGLLEEAGDRQYKLTKKAIGLLWAYYGKEDSQ